MTDAAIKIYESLISYSDLEELIGIGEAEGPHLECKAPSSPQLNKGLKDQLAIALSGFANTAGGVVIWGISTSKHKHSNLDILTQIVPIGKCNRFAKQVDRAVSPLTEPPITTSKTKAIVEQKGYSRGVVLTYIPKTLGDPIRTTTDQQFYFRNSDMFSILPYEMLKRLFAATDSPDLHPLLEARLVSLEKNGFWKIPITIENYSSAVAEHVIVLIKIENPSSCETIKPERFHDRSDINPDERIFTNNLPGVIHRGLNCVAGNLHVHMRGRHRVLKLTIAIFANKMRARQWHMSIQLAKKGFSVEITGENFVY